MVLFFALPSWAQNITTQSPSPIALKTLPESEPPIEQVFQVEEAWQWRKTSCWDKEILWPTPLLLNSDLFRALCHFHY